MILSPDDNSAAIKKRFERDARAFNAIYDEKKSEFNTWLNRTFRKPIFERYEIAFEKMGNLRNKTILDVGCGSGVYTVQCALNGATKAKGIDFSQAMIKLAEKRAEDYGVNPRCQFELQDFLKMENKEQFDFTLAMGVFDYLANPSLFLKKLKIVTRQKIIASFPGHSLIRKPLRKMRYYFARNGRVFFYSYQDLKKLIQDVHFASVEIQPLETGSGFILIANTDG